MGSAYQIPQPFFSGAAPVQKYDEDDSGLDDSMLDQGGVDSGLEMSPAMADSRRDSFAVGGPLFSPKADWPVEMQGPVASSNPFMDSNSNNPFMRMDHHGQPVYSTPPTAWSMTGSPMQQFDGMSHDSYGSGLFARGLSGPAFAGSQMPLFSGLPVTTSPQMSSSQKDWMVAQQQAMAKKGVVDSPVIRSHNDLRRGDGIRKKNARFDIPVERTLSNIDHLISVCKNEADLKELKQQKRLLRNRQAALDSRQRKKQHTERLEDEKKHFTAVINDLEEELVELRNRMELMMRDKQSTMMHIENMNHEKEEMICAHTTETGRLRKKISILSDRIRLIESSPMGAAVQAQAGYSCYDDMDGLNMPGSWDGTFPAFGAVEPEIKQEQHTPQQQQLLLKKDLLGEDKPSAPNGLLVMLLLVGAFVLSNRVMPPVHRVSEDMRVASASLLENVFKDAGVGPTNVIATMAGAPQPSGAVSAGWSGVGMADPSGAGHLSLGELGDSLTQPTQQQTNEQIFSISPAQYNGVMAQDFMHTAPEKTTSQGRRNLADALAAIRNGANRQNGADVYTKSLLWDQIPTQVVRDFAKMISECGSANNQNEQQQQCSVDAVTSA